MHLVGNMRRGIGAGVLAALGLICAGGAGAADSPNAGGECGQDSREPPGPPGPRGGPGDHGGWPGPWGGGPGWPGGPGWAAPPDGSISLTEEQQDKVFAILHAAEPALREHMKAARKARDALRDLGQSADFDAAKATQLAQAQAAAESQLSLLRTRTDHDIYLVLTPEQRTHLERRRDTGPQGHDGPPPHP